MCPQKLACARHRWNTAADSMKFGKLPVGLCQHTYQTLPEHGHEGRGYEDGPSNEIQLLALTLSLLPTLWALRLSKTLVAAHRESKREAESLV